MDEYCNIRCLISELVKGKDEAWSYFLKHYGRLIYYCINRSKNYRASKEDIEDCFQEILRILIEDDFRRLKEVRALEEKAFRSWLGAVTTRRTFNFFRGTKESIQLSEKILDLIPDTSTPVDVNILRNQVVDIINQKLDTQDALVLLYFLDGLTLAEIAKLMDLGLSTIHNIKQRAISEIIEYCGLSETNKNNVSFSNK